MTYQLRLAEGTYAVTDPDCRVLSAHTTRRDAYSDALQRVARDREWDPIPGGGFRDAHGRAVPLEEFSRYVRATA